MHAAKRGTIIFMADSGFVFRSRNGKLRAHSSLARCVRAGCMPLMELTLTTKLADLPFLDARTQKALAFGANPAIAALLGMLTGIGGGMLRDVLVREVPTVLRKELYALAALAGAGVVVAAPLLHLEPAAATIGGAALCFAVRLVAIRRGWRLPTPY